MFVDKCRHTPHHNVILMREFRAQRCVCRRRFIGITTSTVTEQIQVCVESFTALTLYTPYIMVYTAEPKNANKSKRSSTRAGVVSQNVGVTTIVSLLTLSTQAPSALVDLTSTT